MRKLSEPRLVALMAVSGAVLALVIGCSSSDDDSSGGAGTGGTSTGATGGSSTGAKGGSSGSSSSGGTTAHAGTGGAASGGGGAANGGGGAANGGGGAANGGGGAANGGGGAANGGGGAANGGGGAANGGGGAANGGGGAANGGGGAANGGGGGAANGGGGAGGHAAGGAGAGGTSTGGGGTGGTGGAAGSGGAGGFTPVAITLVNPGFDMGTGDARGSIQGWTSTVDGSEVLANVGSYIHYQESGARSPYGFLAMWTQADPYKDDTAQTVTGLTNGKYEFAVWMEGATAGVNSLVLYATDYSGNASDKLTQSVTLTGSYAQYKLSNIPVTSGKLTIGISADCGGNGVWINSDDVTLFRVQ